VRNTSNNQPSKQAFHFISFHFIYTTFKSQQISMREIRAALPGESASPQEQRHPFLFFFLSATVFVSLSVWLFFYRGLPGTTLLLPWVLLRALNNYV